MALEAIGGKVQSEPLNRNFSYLDSRVEEISKKVERVKFSELQEPIYIAHRGAANIFPENTLEAFQGCLALGNPFIEMDVQTLADGSLGVMHDTTVDRTTDKTGRVDDYSAMGFRNLKIDVLPSYKAVTAPLFEDVVATLGKAAIYCPESKDRKSVPKIVETLKRYDLKEYSLIQSFDIDDLQYAIDEGFETLFLTDSYSPGEIKARGINYVGVSTTASDSYIQSCIENGLKVLVYTVNRRYVRDEYLAKGISGFFTDDPFYLAGTVATQRHDPFQSQTFDHGMIACPAVSQYHNGLRGEFKAPDKFGWYTPKLGDDFLSFCLQGWAGVLPHNFTLNAKIILEESAYNSAWASIAFCTTTDYWDDENSTGLSRGYHLLLRENGNLQLYRRDGDVAYIIGEVTTNSWEEGQTAEISIQVTQYEIIVKRIDTNQQFAVQDTIYRNGYLHLGRRALAVSFKDVSIS